MGSRYLLISPHGDNLQTWALGASSGLNYSKGPLGSEVETQRLPLRQAASLMTSASPHEYQLQFLTDWIIRAKAAAPRWVEGADTRPCTHFGDSVYWATVPTQGLRALSLQLKDLQPCDDPSRNLGISDLEA